MKALIKELQRAHSGEIAAYRAYAGHSRVVKDPAEAAGVAAIRETEAAHRAAIEGMLMRLGAKPDRLRDLVFSMIGRVVSASCYVSSHMAVTYGAAFMERVGAVSYRKTAKLANEAGEQVMCSALIQMAYEEERHESYFLGLSKDEGWRT